MHLLLVLLAVLLCAPPVHAGETDRSRILAGVGEIIAPGALPGPVAAWGKEAFVVLTAPSHGVRLPLIAAARHGKGRVVVIGHDGFLSENALADRDNQRLVTNLIAWTGRGKPTVALAEDSKLASWLGQSGRKILRINQETLRHLEAGAVFVSSPRLDGPAAAGLRRELDNYVRRGGGVILDGLGWGWLQLNPGKSLEVDHGGNLFLRPMGLAFADGFFERTGKDGWIPESDPRIPEQASARLALQRLQSHVSGKSPLSPEQLTEASQVMASTISILPQDDRGFAATVHSLCRRHGETVIPSRETPIARSAPFARLAAVLFDRSWKRLPAGKVTAHPGAASFPGAVAKEAPRVRRTLSVDTTVPDWHGTGLYAPPGEPVTITLPASATGRGLAVRIGAHTDTLWHKEQWERFPEVSLLRPLDSQTITLATPFGGSIFLVVPAGSERGGSGSEILTVTIEGAVTAPRFVRGQTTLADWRAVQRLAPGPWAELVGRNVALTVPSAVVRGLDDPESLMAYWDEVLDHCYTLYSAPRRPRPERYCVDRQISAGYMHSGYPIMTGDDVAPVFVNLSLLRSSEGNRIWGFYHEVGHNFQKPEWTFEGTGEVTNNLFSLYGAEKINGITAGAHPEMTPERIQQRFARYRKGGAKFEEWKADPFLALSMYLQVQRAFGWEPFHRVFAEYEALSPDQRPRSDGERRDQWLLRLSRAVGRNLGPFFVAWGVPTSGQARQSLADLPVWLPEELTPGSTAGAAPGLSAPP